MSPTGRGVVLGRPQVRATEGMRYHDAQAGNESKAVGRRQKSGAPKRPVRLLLAGTGVRVEQVGEQIPVPDTRCAAGQMVLWIDGAAPRMSEFRIRGALEHRLPVALQLRAEW